MPGRPRATPVRWSARAECCRRVRGSSWSPWPRLRLPFRYLDHHDRRFHRVVTRRRSHRARVQWTFALKDLLHPLPETRAEDLPGRGTLDGPSLLDPKEGVSVRNLGQVIQRSIG